MMLCVRAACGAEAPTEYQVKAVFVYNFSHFVEWPAQAFAAANAPFVIGILGGDPFGANLDGAGPAEHGGMIQFATENNRIRLRINVEAARAAGLTISSKLLRPADIVGTKD